MLNGFDVMEYAFQVAEMGSHYDVQANGSFVPTAYSGTVWVNRATADVVRMRVVTAQLEARSGACQVDKTLDFGITQIGDAPLLLPTFGRERFIAPDGIETENTTGFSGCREYRGESTISFDEGPDLPAAAGGEGEPAASPRIPAGLAFTLELLAPIDSDRTAAGDAFRARLAYPLRAEKSKVLAPAGSLVEGRLLRVESFHLIPKRVVVVMAPKALWIKGEKVPLAANRNWNSVWREAAARDRTAPRTFVLPEAWEAPAGVFPFAGEHVVIRKGFRSDWLTAAQEARLESR